MTSSGSVAPDERLRLFLALRLPEHHVDEVVEWQERELGGRGLRVVPREHLHVTLAFLGSRPAGELDAIVGVLREAAASARDLRLAVEAYRETRSVAMVVLADDGGRAAALADSLQRRLEGIGVYRREGRPWLPHLTVARFRERPRLAPDPSTMGTRVLIPSDAAAYLSRLHPGGARYEVLATAGLGG